MTNASSATWRTQHSIADLDCSKTQTLMATLRTQNQLQELSCVFFGSRTFVPISWMCKKQTADLAQFYRVWSHLSGCWIADGWAITSRSLGHCDWSVRNVNNIQHNHTGLKETCAVCDSKTKTQVKWITYEPTHILLKESLSCTFWRQWSCDQNDNQRTKSHNETCVKNSSTSWISRWMVVATYKVFFLKPESALWSVPCLNEDRKQPRTMAHRQQKQHLWIWRCTASPRRMSRHKDRDLWSIREMTTKERVGPPSGNWGHSSSNAEVGNSQMN